MSDSIPSLRVVRVVTLGDFMREVPARDNQPAPVVRLLTFRRENFNGFTAQNCISLQGINEQYELAWLTEMREIEWADGQPFGALAISIAEGMSELANQVRDYLTRKGYVVRVGDYALPENLKPIGGHFECCRWVKTGEHTYAVQPA